MQSDTDDARYKEGAHTPQPPTSPPPPQSSYEKWRANGGLNEMSSGIEGQGPLAPSAQMLFFRAAAGKAFTTFRSGLAFTITTLPKTSFLPPCVAGFTRVFSRHKPGRENKPVLPISCVAMLAKLSMTFEHTDFLSSHSVASAS